VERTLDHLSDPRERAARNFLKERLPFLFDFSIPTRARARNLVPNPVALIRTRRARVRSARGKRRAARPIKYSGRERRVADFSWSVGAAAPTPPLPPPPPPPNEP